MTFTQDTINQAKGEFLQAKERLTIALATTPDDRVNWSPSETARTPIQIVAHAAGALKNIHGMMVGQPFEVGSTTEADAGFREWERQFTTREQVLELLEENSDAYVAFLESLTPEQLETPMQLPFGMGHAPIGIGLSFPPGHTRVHTAQIEYIQTIYGDHDWHMGK
jgi:hypothetical protein